MTERLPPLSTPVVTLSQTTAASPKATPALPHHVPSKIEVVDEEPYTIKCICGFSDDDGNTIYCETCDTWQHIECFYPHNTQDAYREDFAHSCADCKPRPLDRHRAFERQSLRQGKPHTTEALERNKKRPPAKSQKKKAKPNDPQVNGHSSSETAAKQGHDNSSTHQHKKTKSTHRSSHSISSQNPKRSPPYNHKPGNPHGHPPSPATTPPDLPQEAEIHNYSSGFMNLYNDDSDVSLVQTNSFASLVISNVLSLWLRDHDKLKQETGCDYRDVFESLPSNIDELKRPPVMGHTKKQIQDAVLRWQYLSTPTAIEKDVPLVELNGQIGIQKNYCEDPENRWAELSSPLPFVFFHPLLPIYIDTRKEGSVARYVRRSCKPNAVLETYLSGGSEYHFWLVSDRKIAPNEQITIPWDFRLPRNDKTRILQLLGLSNEDTNAQPEFDVNEMDRYQTIASWIYTVLSEYGGCACDLRDDCAFVRFYRTYITRTQTRPNTSKKKSRKPKTNTVSPTSTGNSRAPSEGQGDDGVDNDSGSSRSKPPSRDMTPARQGSFDTLGVLTELTDRDKRKVQMVEDTFRRMEQQPPPRKKKRISDGTSSSATTAKPKSRNSASQAYAGFNGSDRRYVDASTSKRSVSRSPGSGLSPSASEPPNMHSSIPISSRRSSQGHRPEYRDASVQTDPVEGEWYSPSHQTPKPKKRVVSLAKKLLGNRHRERAIELERRSMVSVSPTSVVSAMVKMDLDSPSREQTFPIASPTPDAKSKPQIPATEHPTDTPMADAPPLSSAELNISRTSDDINEVIKTKAPELRVQLPPVPTFDGSVPTPTASTTNGPLSTTTSTVQSPFSSSSLTSPFAPPAVNGVVAHPSPVKKKLSLSDYTKSRMNKAAAAKPPVTSLKPPTPVSEEAKSPTATDAVMLDSPAVEKTTNP